MSNTETRPAGGRETLAERLLDIVDEVEQAHDQRRAANVTPGDLNVMRDAAAAFREQEEALREAQTVARTLADFAMTAPGRLPQRIQDAVDAARTPDPGGRA